MDGMARDRFNTIADSIYEEARKKNRDMQVSKESYDFILDSAYVANDSQR